MLIDWFTVAAQALNFLILVWLLKRFLYQPILDAIDAREQRIADELANADAKQREAKKERDEFQQKNAAFAQQQQTLLQDATAAADTERQRLFALAREQADALSAKRQTALQRQQQNLHAELRRLTCDEVFAIARKALTDLAGVSLEQSIIETFLKRLQAMDDSARETFSTVLFSNHIEPVQVRSAFALLPEQQAAIQTAFNNIFATDIALHFETTSRVISGIELSVNGQKIAWSIAEYLTLLEKKLSELLRAVSEPKSQAPESHSTSAPPEVASAAGSNQ